MIEEIIGNEKILLQFQEFIDNIYVSIYNDLCFDALFGRNSETEMRNMIRRHIPMARIAKKCLLLALVLCMLIPTVALAAPVTVTLDVTNPAELKAALYDKIIEIKNSAVATDLTINIKNNIDMGSMTWESQPLPNNLVITINGNNNTIFNLQNMLFTGSWGGRSGLKVSDLTFRGANIVVDKDDIGDTTSPKTQKGVGLIMGHPGAAPGNITLENCSLINSHVEGGHWTGGFFGWGEGYPGDDGPAYMEIIVNNCLVAGNTITGKSSVGGIIGYGLANAGTGITISNTLVSQNTITSTGSDTNKAGAMMGTVGVAGATVTPAGKEPYTAYLLIKNSNALENTITSNGTVIERIWGRSGSAESNITIDGGMYDFYEDDQDLSGVTITKTNNPIFKENLCYITFKDGVNGEVFDGDAVFPCGKGEPTPVYEVPTRAGYTFAGWSPALAATVTADATYTAQWTAVTAATPTPAAPAAPVAPAPKTGDSTPIVMLAVVLMASAAALVWMVSSKRKANQQ